MRFHHSPSLVPSQPRRPRAWLRMLPDIPARMRLSALLGAALLSILATGKATFSIPIGLGAADKAAGKALPQIIMVITGPDDIKAADFSTPTPASVLLPRILDEIGARSSEFSATAKYFRLGG